LLTQPSLFISLSSFTAFIFL